MNFLDLLSCSLLFTAVLGGKCRKLQIELEKVVGAANESIVQVAKILDGFKLAKCIKKDKDDMNWYFDLLIVAREPEVAKRLIKQFLSNSESWSASSILIWVIENKFKISRYHIQPDSADHEIVNFCLRTLSRQYLKITKQFDEIMWNLVKDGNVPVLKSFVEAGYRVPVAVEKFYEIEHQPAKMVKFLFQNGYKANTKKALLAGLFQSRYFTMEDYEELLAAGHLRSGVCLQVAMEAGRLDLAGAAYESGVRLPTEFGGYSSKDLNSFFRALPPSRLVEHVVNQRAMKRISERLAQARNPQSPLFGASRAKILARIAKDFSADSIQSVLDNMFENGSPKK